MSAFGRGLLYYIIVVVIWSLASMLSGRDLSLPWYLFFPLVIVTLGLAYYQTKRKKRQKG